LVTKRVAVIGAGVGWLATSIRLAAMGFEVEVFENNPVIGRRMGRLEGAGFGFDTGPPLASRSIGGLYFVGPAPIPAPGCRW
jgi:phytoene dehydrogenase-like protein